MVNAGGSGSGLLVPFVFPPESSALLALHPRGTRLAVSWEDADAVQVFNFQAGREVARYTGFQHVAGIEFLSADVLLVAARDGCFRCDLRRGGRDVLSSESWLASVTVSPNGRIVALGVEGGLILYNARTGEVLRRLKEDLAWGGPDPATGRRAAFSRSGRYVAAGLRSTYDHCFLVLVWEVRTGRRQRVFNTIAHALAFRGDTVSLALADDWGHINIYERDQGEEPAVRFAAEGEVRALQFRASGATLAALLDQGDLIEFDAKTGRILRREEPTAYAGLNSAVVSGDWSLFAAATEGGVAVWPGAGADPRAAADRPREPG